MDTSMNKRRTRHEHVQSKWQVHVRVSMNANKDNYIYRYIFIYIYMYICTYKTWTIIVSAKAISSAELEVALSYKLISELRKH